MRPPGARVRRGLLPDGAGVRAQIAAVVDRCSVAPRVRDVPGVVWSFLLGVLVRELELVMGA